ncbi:hypothetical protein [Magnetovibrio sp.]|uniref:hypothetical protein n=1 Tax=Magnetovibrio sp. TaxID=2024836 RepID=UPI002F92ECE9
MKSVVRACALVLLAIVLWGGVHPAMAANGDLVEVFIDAREPAYVIYQGVAEDTALAARQEMAGYATLEGISLVPWAQFSANVRAFIAPGIVKNEYPGERTALGLLALLKAHPGRPVAITWNGGIATTFFDFQHAVEVYEAYLENAAGYENSRRERNEDDPLDPDTQIRAMLGG